MFRKEFIRLIKLGVLTEANEYRWGAPSFSQPTSKTNRVKSLIDFRKLNRQLKYKPCPMPKICKILLKLKGFKYATPLSFNMGYYNIRIDKEASNVCTIILPWGKHSYKFLPMGICNSPYIFQVKMNKMIC